MTKEEFEVMLQAPDRKVAIDKFWLDIAGNTERARALISAYYTRVADANRFFTSYLEGWKSDRGMIFIVYGPPRNTYRTSLTETWVYGDERSPKAMTYVFNKLSNPFSENDFALERSINYKNTWYMAVDMWRQGRVYNGR
jgi:GWxTD domain-containing protein